MADTAYTFRTALQGFNRTDVVNFIESTTAAHEAALHQLQVENSRLEQQLMDANRYIDELHQTIADLQNRAAEPVMEEPAVALPPLEDPLPAVAPVMQNDFEEMELAAYRRAEQAERKAKERASELYRQIDEVIAKTNDKLELDDKALTRLTADLSANISALQQTMAKIRSTMDESTLFMRKMHLPLAEDEMAE